MEALQVLESVNISSAFGDIASQATQELGLIVPIAVGLLAIPFVFKIAKRFFKQGA